MCSSKIFCFSLWLIINFVIFTPSGRRIYSHKTERQIDLEDDVAGEQNETTVLDNLLGSDSTESSTENENLFWTIADKNETTEDNKIIEMDTEETMDTEADEKIEESKENEETSDSLNPEKVTTEAEEMDEKIVLQRTNCNLEIGVKDTYDLKMQIKFGQFQNRTSGKCCVTLNGPENSRLAILISNIHLHKNGEVLKMIITNHGSPFILKEYHSESKYQPLILTETNKVYVVLYYNVTGVSLSEEETYFNLEVLTYHKYENHIQEDTGSYYNSYSPIKEQNWYKYYT